MARIELDHGGMAELLRSGGVESALAPRGAAVAASARAIAPRETGALAASITSLVVRRDRVKIRVQANADYAAAVESRTGFLVRALGSAGGR